MCLSTSLIFTPVPDYGSGIVHLYFTAATMLREMSIWRGVSLHRHSGFGKPE